MSDEFGTREPVTVMGWYWVATDDNGKWKEKEK